jgi:hypothetical protein
LPEYAKDNKVYDEQQKKETEGIQSKSEGGIITITERRKVVDQLFLQVQT